MEYKLISPRNKNLTAIEQVLTNRGITDINHYLNTSDTDILNPLLLDNIKKGAKMLVSYIARNDRIHVINDSDVDGYTSSALLLNWLNRRFPHFTQTQVSYSLHKGKEHGIILEEIPADTKLLIVPDAGSSDIEQQKQLLAQGIKTLVLDHHHSDFALNEYACVINNQLCDYPTKSLSGVGIVYKFCSYLDSLLGDKVADDYLDLVALGEIADVVSLADYETKRLIEKGLDNISNPYFKGMTVKNAYSLGNTITPFGVAFYIAPYINAVVRMGTMEEKLVLFESMLDYKAELEVPSTKRGCKGQMETIVDQACRNCANVKNRQTKQRDTSLELIERIIEEKDLLKNKVLIVQLRAKDRTTLTGLVANQIMSKYRRPVLILSETQHDNEIWYEGSGRAPASVGDFRQICEDSKLAEWATGHSHAFGFSITAKNITAFNDYMNEFFKDFDFSPKYDVDFIYDAKNFEKDRYDFYNIMEYGNLWGHSVEQAMIVIENLSVTKDSLSIMRGPTLKFTISGEPDITIIKFKATDEDLEALTPDDSGCVTINVVGVCEKNSYNDKPQLIVKDYEVVERQKYYF